MAYDKTVDSAALDAALGYEAQRIRRKTGGSGLLPFDLAESKGFGAAIDAICDIQVETLSHTLTSDAKNFELTDPRPDQTPKLVTVELDRDGYEGELVSINYWTLFAPLLGGSVLSNGHLRFPSMIRYYDNSGAVGLRTQGTGSGYAGGFSSPRGSVRVPGYNTNTNVYKAGATYVVRLFYW